MRPVQLAAISLVTLMLPRASYAADDRLAVSSVAGGVLNELSVAAFTGQNTIQAIATDSQGNIYVTGTASSANLPVKNAAQLSFGEARILRTTDLGNTWVRVGSPPEDVNAVAADPAAPQVIFAASYTTIYRSADGGLSWTQVYPAQPKYGTLTSVYGGNPSVVIDPGNHLRVAALLPARTPPYFAAWTAASHGRPARPWALFFPGEDNCWAILPAQGRSWWRRGFSTSRRIGAPHFRLWHRRETVA